MFRSAERFFQRAAMGAKSLSVKAAETVAIAVRTEQSPLNIDPTVSSTAITFNATAVSSTLRIDFVKEACAKVLKTLETYSDSLVVIASPSRLVRKHIKSKEEILPGHIHTALILGADKPMADVSFRGVSGTRINSVTPVGDSRLTHVMPESFQLVASKFTDTDYELRKWAETAYNYVDYPLYVLVVPINNVTLKHYMQQAQEFVQSNEGRYCYALLNYFHPMTNEAVMAMNCITIFNMFHSVLFGEPLKLGHNPSVQYTLEQFKKFHMNAPKKLTQESLNECYHHTAKELNDSELKMVA